MDKGREARACSCLRGGGSEERGSRALQKVKWAEHGAGVRRSGMPPGSSVEDTSRERR